MSTPSVTRRQHLRQALFQPGALGRTLGSDPRWGFPAALILLTGMVLDVLALPLFLRAVPDMAPSGLSPEMLADLVHRSRLLRPIQIMLSPLGLLLKWVITAFLLTLMATLVNRKISFRKFFALIVSVDVIHLLEVITKNLLLWVRYGLTGVIVLHPPVGVDAVVRPSGTVPSVLLSYANPFEVWFLLGLMRGTAALSGTPMAKAAVIVLPVWGLWLMAHLALALVREILIRQLGV